MNRENYKFSAEELERFADKYIDYFRNHFKSEGEAYYRFFDDNAFPDECRQLGFEMDCGHSFEEAYDAAWHDLEVLKEKIERINDINIIGNGLFSQWRYYNHWSLGHANEESKEWFLILFLKLKELSLQMN